MVFPHKEFEKTSCLEANIEKGLLADLFDHIEKHQWNVHSMILIKGGKMVFEAYAHDFDATSREEIYSISKSFTSIAIGMLQDEKKIRLDDIALDYFREHVSMPLPGYESVTIRHLLTMTVGVEKDVFHEISENMNVFEKFFTTPLVYTPGEHFVYNNFASFILSAIVTKVTGKSCNAFLKTRLFDPLEIENVEWKEVRGISMGAFGLKLGAVDLAKFGLLLLREGLWKDQQLISKEYIHEATKYHVSTIHWDNPRDKFGYGYQFWMNDFGDFRCAGWLKQYIVVNKEFDVVFVTQAYEERELLDLFSEYLIPSLQKGWLYDSVSLRDYVRRFKEQSTARIENEKATRKV